MPSALAPQVPRQGRGSAGLGGARKAGGESRDAGSLRDAALGAARRCLAPWESRARRRHKRAKFEKNSRLYLRTDGARQAMTNGPPSAPVGPRRPSPRQRAAARPPRPFGPNRRRFAPSAFILAGGPIPLPSTLSRASFHLKHADSHRPQIIASTTKNDDKYCADIRRHVDSP